MRRANTISVIFCYVGTVIGAGFASGQELYTFFAQYGFCSLMPLCMAGGLFGIYGALLLRTVYLKRADSISDYLPSYGKWFSAPLELVIYAYTFISFCVMQSGGGALLHQIIGCPTFVGCAVMALLCFALLCRGASGILGATAVLTPLLILGLISIGVLSAFGGQAVFAQKMRIFSRPYLSALLYVSYNTLNLLAVFLPLRRYLHSARTAIIAGIASGGVLLSLSLLLWQLLICHLPEIRHLEIPMLAIAVHAGKIAGIIYPTVLFIAMITTAISAGLGLLSKTTALLPLPQKLQCVLLCAISLPLSLTRFSDLVASLYGFFGYVGLFVFFFLFTDAIFCKNTSCE